jgi:rubrerythrin
MHGTAPQPAAPRFSATIREPFLALGLQIRRAIASACMPPEVADDVLRVLHACRAIELAMAGLYEALAEIHFRKPSMARLWRKTAREENNHAAQFSLLLEGMPESIQESVIDARALDGLRQAVENTVEEYQLRSPSLREALVAAIDFEEAMDKIHAHQAVIFSDPRCQRMFAAMMAADSGHVLRLRAALRSLRAARP